MKVTLESAWALSPSVALRPEPFGALAYHFGNRKLTFLKRPELVALVRALADHADVRAALTATAIPVPPVRPKIEATVGSESGFVLYA